MPKKIDVLAIVITAEDVGDGLTTNLYNTTDKELLGSFPASWISPGLSQ